MSVFASRPDRPAPGTQAFGEAARLRDEVHFDCYDPRGFALVWGG